MDYIVTKQTPRFEWRIYIDKETSEGKILYKGHKLGIEKSHMKEVLEFRNEKSSNNIYYLDYEKAINGPDHKDLNIWIRGVDTNVESIAEKSWESLISMIQKKNGKFRKISLTKVNI